MSEREKYPPKAEWGPGPWQDEPDEVEWETEVGYKAFACRNPHTGTWCGYVQLPPNHPWFGKEYTWCTEGCPEQPYRKDEITARWSPGAQELFKRLDRFRCPTYAHHVEGKLEAHGGVTWGGAPGQLAFAPKTYREGLEVGGWAFGFDTAHAGDVMPAMDALMRKLNPMREEHPRFPGESYIPGESYKTLDYVRAECEQLAVQLLTEERLAEAKRALEGDVESADSGG